MADEMVLALAALALLLALLALLLAILALVRAGGLDRVHLRLQDLEDEVARLRRTLRRRLEPVREAAEPAAALAPPEVPAETIPEVLPAEPAAPLPPAVSWEEWIGRRGLGWAAAVLLLLATAFFLKYAFDNRWIGEMGRVALGLAAGSAFVVAGHVARRRGFSLYGQTLTAAGILLLYVSAFAAFGYYRLLPPAHAAAFLVALTVLAGGLAVALDAPAVALLALAGGLLNPVLLQTDRDQYPSLFTYLLVLNVGVAVVTVLRPWRVVALAALLGTQALWWGWWAGNFHPDKLAAALAFQGGLFAVTLVPPLAAALRRRRTDALALVLVVLNAFLFAVAAYVLLRRDWRPWLGSAAVALAALHTGLAWLTLHRHSADARLPLVLGATALAFLAAAFPLQARAAWIALGWAVEGAALWWFGLRTRSHVLRGLAAGLLALAAVRLVTVDLFRLHDGPFIPVLNKGALPALGVAACALFVAAADRWLPAAVHSSRLGPGERLARTAFGLAGVVLVWLILSVETYQGFTSRIQPWSGDPTALTRAAWMSVSVLWSVYAAGLLALGFRLDSRPLRWTALGLFGLTMAKVLVVDMAELPGFYRVAAFFVLAVLMGGAAWLYQKIERAHSAAYSAAHRAARPRETLP